MSEEIRAGTGEISLQAALDWVRRIWRVALLGGIVAAALGGVLATARPKTYVARASFVAEQSRLPGMSAGLGALAAQFGIDMASNAGRSPHFYRDLLTASGILRALLDSVVVSSDGAQPVRTLFGGGADTARRATDRALRRFRKRIGATADVRTSVVSFSVRAATPEVAERLAAMLLDAIRHFNVATRQLQARERRQFLDGRVAEARQQLRDSEEGLRRFYERNRRFSESPALAFEESRMKRDLDLQQEVYTTLAQELETARIQEVNDTPTITIVDRPFATSKPNGPGLPSFVVGFFMLGTLTTAVWALAITALRGPRDRVVPASRG